MTKDTGGSAFPKPYKMETSGPNNGEFHYRGDDGMTLRDYFAGQALQGLLASPNTRNANNFFNEIADDCYATADAMLAAREQ